MKVTKLCERNGLIGFCGDYRLRTKWFFNTSLPDFAHDGVAGRALLIVG